jgi:hypothetical protein
MSLDKLLRYRNPVQTDVYCPVEFCRTPHQKDDLAVSLTIRDGDDTESIELAGHLQLLLPLELRISAAFLSRCSKFASPVLASAAHMGSLLVATQAPQDQTATSPGEQPEPVRYEFGVLTKRIEVQYSIESDIKCDNATSFEVHAVSMDTLQMRIAAEDSAAAPMSFQISTTLQGLQAFCDSPRDGLMHYLLPSTCSVAIQIDPVPVAHTSTAQPRVAVQVESSLCTLVVGPLQILALQRAVADAKKRVGPLFSPTKGNGDGTDPGPPLARSESGLGQTRDRASDTVAAFEHCLGYSRMDSPNKLTVGQMGCIGTSTAAPNGKNVREVVWKYVGNQIQVFGHDARPESVV